MNQRRLREILVRTRPEHMALIRLGRGRNHGQCLLADSRGGIRPGCPAAAEKSADRRWEPRLRERADRHASQLFPGATCTRGSGKQWRVAYSEEFNGTALDTTKLTPCFDWNYGACTASFNTGKEHYLPSQVQVIQRHRQARGGAAFAAVCG